MKKYTALVLVLFLIVGTLFVGCGGSSNEVALNQETDIANDNSSPATVGDSASNIEIPQGGVIKVAYWNAAPGVFAPGLSTNSYDFYVFSAMFESLLRFDPEYNLEPCLAEAYSVSEDQKTYTFKLREGVTWHDGVEFTTEDVKFTLEFLGHPDYPGASGSHIAWLEGAKEFKNGDVDFISGINIIDKYNISLTTSDTFGSALKRLSTTNILAKHIWENVEIAKALEAKELLQNPVGTGPFKIKEFVPDQYTELEAYENYWNGKPHLDKMIIMSANQETAQAQMLNGNIDIMLISKMNPDDLELYEDMGIDVQEMMMNSNQYMGFNHSNELFKDKKVRQAFAYAINRQAMVDGILNGYGEIALQPYRPDFWASSKNLNSYDYNPETAIKLLEEAGWKYDASAKTMKVNGKNVKIVLKYPSGNQAREQAALVIQQNLKDIGIEIDLQIMEFNTLYTQVKEGDYELYLMAEGASTGDPDIKRFYHTDFMHPNGLNLRQYSNPRLDELFEAGEKFVDRKEQEPFYQEISEILNEDLPMVYLFFWYEGRAVNGKLKNVISFAGTPYYKAESWYLEK